MPGKRNVFGLVCLKRMLLLVMKSLSSTFLIQKPPSGSLWHWQCHLLTVSSP